MKEQKITIPEGFELRKVNDSDYRIVKKDELPNSWKEFCENCPVRPGEGFISRTSDVLIIHEHFERVRKEDTDKNLLPNYEYAEAILAFCQLIQLRDCYRQGWKPNWNNNDMKLTVEQHYEDIVCSAATHVAQIFTFQSKEIRDKFYKNFKDLIEKTKPLFM